MNPVKLRKTFMKCCIGLVLATMMSACGGSGNGDSTPSPVVTPTPTPAPTPTPPPTLTSVSFAAKIQPIFNGHCIICHSRTGIPNIPWLDSGTYTNLVGRPSLVGAGTLVIPGDSAGSMLYQRVSGIGLSSVLLQMPLGGPFLSVDDQNLIKTWIDQGAKNN